MGLLHEKVHGCWVKSALLTPISRACTSPWAHLSTQRPQETAPMNLMWREGRDQAARLREQLPLTRRGCKILVTLAPKGCSRYSPSLNGTDGETEAQGQWDLPQHAQQVGGGTRRGSNTHASLLSSGAPAPEGGVGTRGKLEEGDAASPNPHHVPLGF